MGGGGDEGGRKREIGDWGGKREWIVTTDAVCTMSVAGVQFVSPVLLPL